MTSLKNLLGTHLRSLLRKIFFRFAPTGVKRFLGIFPISLHSEKKALVSVLRTGQWNMSYGPVPAHVKLENAFAEYVGSSYAVTVAGGGMGIQMSLRALGLQRNSEVLMQVDTCSAVAFSAINAQTIPRFYDANPNTFLSNLPSAESKVSTSTGAIISSHLWGNPDDIAGLANIARNADAYLIEDCCLALGTTISGQKVGTTGKVGIFSFGSTKPIQAGEGGIIVTEDHELAKELRAMRHWGERTKDFGIRDVEAISWNGRISEFSAAVALEQLKGFPKFLEQIRENIHVFNRYLLMNNAIGFLNFGNAKFLDECSFTQATLTLNLTSQDEKSRLLTHLAENGISAFQANFEPIPTLSVFKTREWEKWINAPKWDPISELHKSNFPEAFEIFSSKGIGISRSNFQSKYRVNKLISAFESFVYGQRA